MRLLGPAVVLLLVVATAASAAENLTPEDRLYGLSLLWVEAIRTPLPIRPSHELVKGMEVFTLGYPLVALQGQ